MVKLHVVALIFLSLMLQACLDTDAQTGNRVEDDQEMLIAAEVKIGMLYVLPEAMAREYIKINRTALINYGEAAACGHMKLANIYYSPISPTLDKFFNENYERVGFDFENPKDKILLKLFTDVDIRIMRENMKRIITRYAVGRSDAITYILRSRSFMDSNNNSLAFKRKFCASTTMQNKIKFGINR